VKLVTPWLLWLALAAPFAVLALHLHDRARRRRLTGRLGELPVLGKVIASASPASLRHRLPMSRRRSKCWP